MTATSPQADPGPKPADHFAPHACPLCHQHVPTEIVESAKERLVGRLIAATVLRHARLIERSPAASSNEMHTTIAASGVGVPLSADRPTTQDERRRGDGSMYAEDALEAIDPEPYCEMTGPAAALNRQTGSAERATGAALAAIYAWSEYRRLDRDIARTSFARVSAARVSAERAMDEAVRLLVAWRGGAA